MMLSIILLALLGSAISAVIGTIWYSPATPMGRVHMQYLGFDKLSAEEQKKQMEKAKPDMPKMYAAQFALSLLTSFAVVFIVTQSLHNGLTLGMAAGFIVMNWLCFMVPIIGSSLLWSNCDRKIVWQKFFSDIACNLVTVLVIALVSGLIV